MYYVLALWALDKDKVTPLTTSKEAQTNKQQHILGLTHYECYYNRSIVNGQFDLLIRQPCFSSPWKVVIRRLISSIERILLFISYSFKQKKYSNTLLEFVQCWVTYCNAISFCVGSTPVSGVPCGLAGLETLSAFETALIMLFTSHRYTLTTVFDGPVWNCNNISYSNLKKKVCLFYLVFFYLLHILK